MAQLLSGVARVSVAFLLLMNVAVGTADAAYELVLMHNFTDAVCLDGSPSGFYISQGRPDRWVIWFQGGGWCASMDDCAARAATRLGSSLTWAPSYEGAGILNTDPAWNPDFFNATLVYMQYCDGASFASYVEQPVAYNSTFSLHFRGTAIRDAMLATLSSKFGLGSVAGTSLVVTGSSAGGLSTYLHVDHIADILGPNVLTVGMPDAGWFLTGPTISGGIGPWVAMMAQVAALHNITTAGQQNAACWTNTPPANQWQCLWAQYLLPHISSPVFVLNSQYDWVQLQSILELPLACVDAPLTNCTQAEWNALQGWHILWQESFNQSMAAGAPGTYQRNGAFVSSCIQHEEGYVDRRWSNDTIAGVTMRDAFGAWFAAHVQVRSSSPKDVHAVEPSSTFALGLPQSLGSVKSTIRRHVADNGHYYIDPLLWPNNTSCQPPGP